MSKYGVLLVGGKRTHQEGHAPKFAAHPMCRLVAVADEPDVSEFQEGLARQLADELGIPYVADLEQALARDDVHIVSSTPEVERRGRVAVRCIEAGKHVYLDKPLAGTLEDADAIVAAAQRSGARTQMYTMVHAGWVQAAGRALEEGRVGALKAIHAENLFSKGRAGTVPPGTVRQERERVQHFTFVEAKREMFDIGVYSIGVVRWLTGRQVRSVYALTGNYVFAEHAGVDVEDFGAIALTMDGGVSATIVGGRIGWSSHPKSGPQKVVLIGTDGTLTIDAWRPRVEVYNDEPPFTPPPVNSLDPMGMWGPTAARYRALPRQTWVGFDEHVNSMSADVAAFIDCIEQGREPEMNAATAAHLLEVILAGYVSSARGEPVDLPLTR